MTTGTALRPGVVSPRRPVPAAIARPALRRDLARDPGRPRRPDGQGRRHDRARCGSPDASPPTRWSRSGGTSRPASPPTSSTASATTSWSPTAPTRRRWATRTSRSRCARRVNEVICHGIPDSRPLAGRRRRQGRHHRVHRRRARRHLRDVLRRRRRRTRCASSANAPTRRCCAASRRSRPGRPISVIGRVIESYAKRFGYGVVRDYTGHGVGPCFHTKPTILHYDEPRATTVLEPGMTFTIEPMLTLGGYDWFMWDDGWTVLTKDGSWAAQWEHTDRGHRRRRRDPDPAQSALTPRHDRLGAFWPNLRVNARQPDTVRSWTRCATPTPPAPASARPSWPAATASWPPSTWCSNGWRAGRPERSVVLTGLRGVGKTVLLNAMRSAAVRRGWGTGKLEARPDQSVRRAAGRPPCTWPCASSPAATRTRRATSSACVKSFAQRETARQGPGRGSPGIDVPGRARARRLGRHRDRPRRAAHRRRPGWPPTAGTASRSSSTRCRTSAPTTSRRCARPATRSPSRALPLVVVGAGLPHLPAVLSAAKSYSERLFRYARIDRLDRAAADARPARPGPRRGRRLHRRRAARRCTRRPAATPTSSRPTARSRGTSRRARRSRRPTSPSPPRRPRPNSAVGFFGSRYERATPAEREYLRAMAEVGRRRPTTRCRPRPWPTALGRPPQSLSPARDGLLKKGLVYSGAARPDRVHRPALRPVPARAGLTDGRAPRVTAAARRAAGSRRASRCRRRRRR